MHRHTAQAVTSQRLDKQLAIAGALGSDRTFFFVRPHKLRATWKLLIAAILIAKCAIGNKRISINLRLLFNILHH